MRNEKGISKTWMERALMRGYNGRRELESDDRWEVKCRRK